MLCDQTAIVGVLKQMNLNAGELKEITINFGKENFESGPELYLSDEDYDA